MRKFSEVLSQLRKEKNISQRALSDSLGLSHSTIGMYENGQREPNYDILERIADYFNVDMNYLLGKTLIRNSYRELGSEDYLGNYDENIVYLQDKPELLELYQDIVANDRLVILFDKAKKLEPEELEQVLKIIDTFNKETKG